MGQRVAHIQCVFAFLCRVALPVICAQHCGDLQIATLKRRPEGKEEVEDSRKACNVFLMQGPQTFKFLH